MSQIERLVPSDSHVLPDPENLFTIEDRINEGANLYYIQKTFKGAFQVVYTVSIAIDVVN
jgi:hypothetical protein